VRELRASIEQIERRDADLGRQMRRALSSVALNAAEAQESRGRNRQVRFSTALGSMRETKACLDVSAALCRRYGGFGAHGSHLRHALPTLALRRSGARGDQPRAPHHAYRASV